MSKTPTPGRIVHYRLTSRETLSKESIGQIRPAIVISTDENGALHLAVALDGRKDMPQVVQWEPEQNRVPLVLVPWAWVVASEGLGAGEWAWPEISA